MEENGIFFTLKQTGGSTIVPNLVITMADRRKATLKEIAVEQILGIIAVPHFKKR